MNAGTGFLAGHSVVRRIFLWTSVSRLNLRTVRPPLGRVAVAACFLAAVASAFPSPSRAAWVNSTGTAFQVGGVLTTPIVPALPAPPGSDGPSVVADPTCLQESTSLALVSGSKL